MARAWRSPSPRRPRSVLSVLSHTLRNVRQGLLHLINQDQAQVACF